MKPPTRLLEDPGSAAELRFDLMHAKDAVEPYDVARGLAQLEASLDASAKLGDGTGAATDIVSGIRATARERAGLSSAAKLRGTLALLKTFKVGIVLLFGAGAIGVAFHNEHPAPSARAPEEDAPVEEPSLPALARPASTTDRASERKAPSELKQVAAESASRREITQLLRIKRLLTRDPAAAYRLAERAQREFPNGALHEECEGLGLLALWKLGRGESARRETHAFLERHPQSPLRARLQSLLADSQGR